MQQCVGTFVDPRSNATLPRVWSNAPYNFDNLAHALISLFVVVTLNGYSDIMEDAMSAPEEKGVQPVPHSNSRERPGAEATACWRLLVSGMGMLAAGPAAAGPAAAGAAVHRHAARPHGS